MNEEDKKYPLDIVPGNIKNVKSKKKYAVLMCLAIVVTALITTAVFKISPIINSVFAEALATTLIDNEPLNGEQLAANLPTDNNNESLSGEQSVSLSSQHMNVVDVVKFVSPSVVSINVSSPNNNTPITGINRNGSGSGIIISEDNDKIYIVTNKHVLQDATQITISIDDIKEAVAYLVGGDVKSDLAVISVVKDELKKADIDHYTIALLGDSDLLEIGEYVVAVGNAFGEGQTVTDGIVSAKNREINLDDIRLTVLQTNTAINQGNSGGPLVNMDGEVVGINTAKLTSAGVEGVGYSIPINDAKKVIDRIIQNPNNSTDKPQLGIRGITITSDMMNKYGFLAEGVYIFETLPGSNAESAGLRNEDIIIAFEGARVNTIEDLAFELQKCSFGDTVKIYVYRGGASTPERIDMTVLNTSVWE